jgi:hypothetical protein
MKTTINNSEREMWVMNDEGLYNWWKRSRLSKRKFISEHREEIDAAIRSVRDAPPRTKTWRDYNPRRKNGAKGEAAAGAAVGAVLGGVAGGLAAGPVGMYVGSIAGGTLGVGMLRKPARGARVGTAVGAAILGPIGAGVGAAISTDSRSSNMKRLANKLKR